MMFTLVVSIVRLKNKTMSGLRQFRREQAKSKKKLDERTQHFSNICIEFSAILLNNNFDLDSEAVVIAFDKYNSEWKNYARRQIAKNPREYNKSSLRVALINGFEVFVNKYVDQQKPIQDLKESIVDLVENEPGLKDEYLKQTQTEDDKDMEWYDYPIDDIKDALANVDIKSQARTIKGLKPVVANLDEDQLKLFNRRLGLS